MILDLSKKPRLTKGRHYQADYDQLYHPLGNFDPESIDLVYINLNIENRFSPIIFKEAFSLIKVKGFLVIEYISANDKYSTKTEETLWWLWKQKYNILFHDSVDSKIKYSDDEEKLIKYFTNSKNTKAKKRHFRLVLQKTNSILLKNDDINKWTFGIVTNGKRNEWVEKIIDSIRLQKIPHYEILICGAYKNIKDKDIRYLPFSDRDNLGWITKKKNLMVKMAKYENLCIIHDRVVFDKKWFKGMQKWGNVYDHLGCIQTKDGHRIADWVLHEGIKGQEFGFATLADYREWSVDIFQSGTLHILKRTYALEYPWNESYLWANERPEDLELSNNLTRSGHILRFNALSKMEVLASRFDYLPSIPFEEEAISTKREGNLKYIIGRIFYRKLCNINPDLASNLLRLYFKIKP